MLTKDHEKTKSDKLLPSCINEEECGIDEETIDLLIDEFKAIFSKENILSDYSIHKAFDKKRLAISLDNFIKLKSVRSSAIRAFQSRKGKEELDKEELEPLIDSNDKINVINYSASNNELSENSNDFENGNIVLDEQNLGNNPWGSEEELAQAIFFAAEKSKDLELVVDQQSNIKFANDLEITESPTTTPESISESLMNSSSYNNIWIKPIFSSQRNTLILREMGEATTHESIMNLLRGCPKFHKAEGDENILLDSYIMSVKQEVNETWFVTCTSEEVAVDVALWLRSQTYNGKLLRVGFKSEHPIYSLLSAQSSRPQTANRTMPPRVYYNPPGVHTVTSYGYGHQNIGQQQGTISHADGLNSVGNYNSSYLMSAVYPFGSIVGSNQKSEYSYQAPLINTEIDESLKNESLKSPKSPGLSGNRSISPNKPNNLDDSSIQNGRNNLAQPLYLPSPHYQYVPQQVNYGGYYPGSNIAPNSIVPAPYSLPNYHHYNVNSRIKDAVAMNRGRGNRKYYVKANGIRSDRSHNVSAISSPMENGNLYDQSKSLQPDDRYLNQAYGRKNINFNLNRGRYNRRIRNSNQNNDRYGRHIGENASVAVDYQGDNAYWKSHGHHYINSVNSTRTSQGYNGVLSIKKPENNIGSNSQLQINQDNFPPLGDAIKQPHRNLLSVSNSNTNFKKANGEIQNFNLGSDKLSAGSKENSGNDVRSD